jgi:hypothetical protein
MGVMSYWFFKRPGDYEKDQAFYYFRMMDPDFSPHPVYYALKEQASATPILGLGYHQEDHWAVRYQGTWEDVADADAVLGGYRASANAGDSLSFVFWGTDLSLVPVCHATSGRLELVVDGQRTELDLGSLETSYGSEVLLVGGLPEGTHEAQLTVASSAQGGGQVAIDSLIVRHSSLSLVRRGLAWSVLACLAVSILYIVWRHLARKGSPG